MIQVFVYLTDVTGNTVKKEEILYIYNHPYPDFAFHTFF